MINYQANPQDPTYTHRFHESRRASASSHKSSASDSTSPTPHPWDGSENPASTTSSGWNNQQNQLLKPHPFSIAKKNQTTLDHPTIKTETSLIKNQNPQHDSSLRVFETGDRVELKTLTGEIKLGGKKETKFFGIKKWRSWNPTTTWYESNLWVRGFERLSQRRKLIAVVARERESVEKKETRELGNLWGFLVLGWVCDSVVVKEGS